MKTTRYYPVIDGFKICKVCLENKELIIDFQYHSPTKCYSGTCKNCSNSIRRKNNTPISGRREGDSFIRQKFCKKCGEVKDLTEENFTKNSKGFNKICINCEIKYRELRLKERLLIGPLPLTTRKVCTNCNVEQTIGEFYYSRAKNMYTAWCKCCYSAYRKNMLGGMTEEEKSARKLEKGNWNKGNRDVILFSNYSKIDYKKNFQNDLTKEYIQKMLKLNCVYCDYPSTGLDRIDNTKGHTQENCVSCCWECNTARMNNFTHKEMFVIGKAIKQIKDNR